MPTWWTATSGGARTRWISSWSSGRSPGGSGTRRPCEGCISARRPPTPAAASTAWSAATAPIECSATRLFVESDEVFVSFAADGDSALAAADEDDGGARDLVGVGGHRVAVRAGDGRAEDVAGLELQGNLGVAHHDVTGLAVLADHRHLP